MEECFSAALFRLRILKGLTQRDVAGSAAVARSYYCALENSRRPAPPAATLNRISKALNLDPKEHQHLRMLAEAERRITKHHVPYGDLHSLLQLIGDTMPLTKEKLQRIQAILEEK
ncbi:helix-turn-helix domain-containing protein [Herbaspirillum huttiense]|uniref:helix-turn-helix domain-containing protein n=1 Tax=Herbaspirillum huttiense TaxID=863372 RepID=UPI003D04BFF3